MEKFCQSCSMPLELHGQDVRGSEKDGSQSQIYCSYCYVNGAFVEPDITFEQMVNKGKTAIANGQGNALVKFFMKASYPKKIKKRNVGKLNFLLLVYFKEFFYFIFQRFRESWYTII